MPHPFLPCDAGETNEGLERLERLERLEGVERERSDKVFAMRGKIMLLAIEASRSAKSIRAKKRRLK